MKNSEKKTRNGSPTKKDPDTFRRRETATEGLIKEICGFRFKAVPGKKRTVLVEVTSEGETKTILLAEKDKRRATAEFSDGTKVLLNLYTAIPVNVGVQCKGKTGGYMKIRLMHDELTRQNIHLIEYAKSGETEKVEDHLSIGADINARDPMDVFGRTALILASQWGHVNTVELLLERGADVNITSTVGWNAAEYAAMAGEHEIVGLLRNKGASIGGPIVKLLRTSPLESFKKVIEHIDR